MKPTGFDIPIGSCYDGVTADATPLYWRTPL